MISKTEELVIAISSMDIPDIEALLSSKYLYQDATKKMYLKKLAELFSRYKSFGDSKFLVNNGCCNSKQCNNLGCNGYSFVGNVSKNYFNLVFTETDSQIKGIDYCYEFKIDNLDLDLNDELRLNIENHETFGYLYFLNKNKAYLCFLELSKDDCYSFNNIKTWFANQDFNTLINDTCERCGGFICICGNNEVKSNVLKLYNQIKKLIDNVDDIKFSNQIITKGSNKYFEVNIKELNDFKAFIKLN